MPVDLVCQKFDAFIDDDMQAKPCIYEKSPEELAAYFSGIKNNKTVTVNSFPSSLVAGNKRLLAYLHLDNFKKYFSVEENNAIDKLIPKTSTFVDGINQPSKEQINDFIANKNNFAIKKVIATRGRGVVIGKQCSPELWQTYLSEACGLLSRVSSDMIINIGKLGCMRPVYIL